MSLHIAGHQTEGYRVSTPVYEGPLDLLLDLIERAELDITSLALAQVTDQYLAYLAQLQDRDADQVSAFLVIATRLVLIKSQKLLPRPPDPDNLLTEEEDPGEALARQLILYKRFKELAVHLEQRDSQGLRTFLRLAAPPIKVDAHFDLSGVSLADLLLAAQESLLSQPSLTNLDRVVNMPRITIRDKIKIILDKLNITDRAKFHELLNTRSRVEIVVTFLAMLELVKRHIIHAQQESLFGEIQLQAEGPLQDAEVAELDFSE